ncbi:MAG: glycosyltransferase family 2 protein [Bacteroidales bacterium]|nr:glycosyltransferase family 2 protein [Bacteroidales bacterium]
MMMNKTLTVFTPAYNRAHTIGRTYASLCRQTSDDFKWIVVDDGSTDNTRELVAEWIDQAIITIEYYYKNNGGMHTAHNCAYQHIETELAVCIDSDDYLPDNAVESIINRWREFGNDSKYAGIIGIDRYENGEIVGTPFPNDLKECRVQDLWGLYRIRGDKKYVFKTDIIKKYLPYPEFPGEKNMTVNYVYYQISMDYLLLCTNDCYCVVEYQSDGLSAGIFRQYIKSPKSFMYTRNVYMDILPSFSRRFRQAIHYVSSAIFAKDSQFIRKASRKLLVIFALPFGALLNLYIRYVNR